MHCLLQGEMPSNDETVALFHLLSQANVDLRQPISLEEQLMDDSEMEAEVGLAMVQLLKVRFQPCCCLLCDLRDCAMRSRSSVTSAQGEASALL